LVVNCHTQTADKFLLMYGLSWAILGRLSATPPICLGDCQAEDDVNGKARSRMPREGRDTSGACVGLMLVVHCQSLLNLHWIIFSRETVATASGYNKQAKRTPSPTCHTHPQSSVSSAQYFAHPNIFQRGNNHYKSCGKSSRSVSKAHPNMLQCCLRARRRWRARCCCSLCRH
jgi:hypothetical protein